MNITAEQNSLKDSQIAIDVFLVQSVEVCHKCVHSNSVAVQEWLKTLSGWTTLRW